jgi:serine/threonine protein kinase
MSLTSSTGSSVTQVAGKYEIQDADVLGKGAWSVVKKCVPIPPYLPAGATSGMKFVVKIIEKDYLISLTKGDVDRAMLEVKREIEILKHIPAHPNVVTFIEHVETDKQFLLIFEEVPSGDLCELILKTSGARIDEKRARKYTYQLIMGVLHCHVHDVIHRDIKPENLLVTDKDDLKLTDFGLAKWTRAVTESVNRSGGSSDLSRLLSPFPGAERLSSKKCVCSDVIGTPRYGAPEMFYAKFTQTQYDGYKADTWSIGVVAYIMLSGTFPFFSGSGTQERDTFKAIMDTPLVIPNTVTSAAADFLQRLLHKDPLKRMTLVESLDHPWLEPEVVSPLPDSVSKLRRLGHDAKAIATAAEDEILLLHSCITKLRRELQLQKWKTDGVGAVSSSSSSSAYGSSKRTETPTGASSRARPATSPSNAARLQSPGRIASGAPLLNQHNARTPSATSTNGHRTSSPVRREEVSRGSAALASKQGTSPSASARTASPLVRSSPSTLRRGTPMRPSSAATGSAAVGTSATTPKTPTPAKRATTPVSSRLLTPSSRAGSSPSASMHATGPTASSVATAAAFAVGDQVIYKNCRAVVQFSGPTTFGSGVWIGLEMLEGSEGTNDGASFVDKKRYFTCPKGKGVFVRASQIRKADE